MNKQLPIYNLKVNEDDLKSGVFAISLVDEPAIESDWFAFSKQNQEFQFKTVNKDKQILAGFFLIPDKLIFRKDESGKEYYVKFDRDTINTISEKFNRNLLSNQFNIQHNGNDKVTAFVKENWIIESLEFDKSKTYGFEPIEGGWFGLVKVNDAGVWSEYVKTGKLKGFSVEGMFDMELVKMNKQEKPNPIQQFYANIYKQTQSRNEGI